MGQLSCDTAQWKWPRPGWWGGSGVTAAAGEPQPLMETQSAHSVEVKSASISTKKSDSLWLLIGPSLCKWGLQILTVWLVQKHYPSCSEWSCSNWSVKTKMRLCLCSPDWLGQVFSPLMDLGAWELIYKGQFRCQTQCRRQAAQGPFTLRGPCFQRLLDSVYKFEPHEPPGVLLSRFFLSQGRQV